MCPLHTVYVKHTGYFLIIQNRPMLCKLCEKFWKWVVGIGISVRTTVKTKSKTKLTNTTEIGKITVLSVHHLKAYIYFLKP